MTSTQPASLKRSSGESFPKESLAKQIKLDQSDEEDTHCDSEKEQQSDDTTPPDATAASNNEALDKESGDDALGSDLDDSEDEADIQDTDNIILCQFEKVTVYC